MANLKNTGSKGASLLSVAVMLLCATTAAAQNATDRCRPAPVIPLASEPPAKIVSIHRCLDRSLPGEW